MPGKGTAAAVWVDRFVSASSADDARESLTALLEGVSAPADNLQKHIPPSEVWHNDELLEALLQVLTTGQHKDLPLDDGPSTVCRLYLQLWKHKTTASLLLKQPHPGQLLQSVLDVVCDKSNPNYTRVLALQLLGQCCTYAPALAESQLLEAPNGLHRLADVFRDTEQVVRNEMLVVALPIASWPSCQKVWVFAEVCATLSLILTQEGGLTGGNVVVMDALALLDTLVDPSLADLIWESPVIAPQLATLLDLRGGTEFLSPPKPPQLDDLDAILAATPESTPSVVPHLTPREEQVITKVLHILSRLLDTPRLRANVWKQHKPLCSLVWELALVTPSTKSPVCAMPSNSLQQHALETISLYFNDPVTMERHYGMDRLLYLVCAGTTTGLSQAALHVLRETLPLETANQIMIRTLAPPMTDDEHDHPPTTIQKLLNTVLEHLASSSSSSSPSDNSTNTLVGALGALGMFVQGPTTTKEMLLRITTEVNLVDTLMEFLQTQQDDPVKVLAILRFVSEWMVDTPAVIQAVMGSHHSSVTWSTLFQSSNIWIKTMTGFVLGLAMEYMSDDDEEKYGGWTRQSILALISKRGISQYTVGLEEGKKRNMEFPWSACDLEWQGYLKWYSAQVLVIRRRLVKEMTASHEEDEESTDEPHTKNSASVKSLNTLVAQQAQELEQLRESLIDAQSTISSQKSQLDVWKRRIESTPTQLDSMLTEYTVQNAELETTIRSLQQELQETNERLQAELNERDAQALKVQAEMRECQEREREAQEQRDALQEQMEGLSVAYASLEEEYNRGSTAAGEDTNAAGQPPPPQQQPEGEVSHQVVSNAASTELISLRAENARLWNDAREADSWMSMAVHRLNDLGAENAALQEELSTLRQELQQQSRESTPPTIVAAATNAVDTAALEIANRQLQDEQNRRQRLEQRVNAVEIQNASLQHELAALKDQLELSERAQNEIKISTSALGAAQAERDNMRTQVEFLRKQLEEKDQHLTRCQYSLDEAKQALSVKVDGLQADLNQRDELIQNLNAELELAKDAHADAAQLHIVLQNSKDECTRLRTSLEEAKLTAQQANERNEDFEQIRAELKHIREENARLEEDREMLQESSDRVQAEIVFMKREKASLSSERDRLKGQLELAERAQNENTTSALRAAQVERDNMGTQVEFLRSQLEEKEQYVLQWQYSLDEAKQALSVKVDEMQADLNQRDELIQNLRDELELEKDAHADAAQLHIVLQNSKDECVRLRTSLEEAKLSAQHANERSEDCEQIRAELKHMREVYARLENDRQALVASHDRVQAEMSCMKQEQASLSAECEMMTATIEDLQTKCSTLQSIVNTSEETCGNLQCAKEALEQQLKSLTEAEIKLRNDLAASRTELTATLEETAGLRTMNANLSATAEIFEREKEEWDDMRSKLEEEVRRLESVCEEATERTRVSEAQLREKQGACIAVEDALSRLRMEFDEFQSKSEDIVGRWRERADELEVTVNELETQQEQVAASASSWETLSSNLQAKLLETESDLLKVKEERDKLSHSLMATEQEMGAMHSLHADVQAKALALATAEELLITERNSRQAEHSMLLSQLEEEKRAAKLNAVRAEALQSELMDVKMQMVAAEDRWNARVFELEQNIQNLQEDLEEKENLATEVIAKWETHCSLIESRSELLENDLQVALSERDDLSSNIKSMEETLQVLEEEQKKVSPLAEKVDFLTMQLAESTEQSEFVISQWEERVNELEAAVKELEVVVNEKETENELYTNEATQAISLWESRCAALEEKVLTLEEALDASTTNLIASLQSELHAKEHLLASSSGSSSVTTLDSRIQSLASGNGNVNHGESASIITNLKSELEETNKLLSKAVENLITERNSWQLDYKTMKDNLNERHQEVLRLRNEVDELERNMEDEKASHRRVHDVEMELREQEGKVKNLEAALEKEKFFSATTGAELQNLKANLEGEEKEFNDELAKERSARIHVEGTIAKMEKSLLETEQACDDLKSQLAAAIAQVSQMEDTIENERLLATKTESKWKQELSEHQDQMWIVMQERDDLKDLVGQFEEELRDAQDTLQARVTDEISEKAADIATHALRCEMEEMRSQSKFDQGAFAREKEARLQAEKEVEQLKGDLAILLRVEGHALPPDQLQKLTVKAADSIRREEHREMDELRTTLERALHELTAARTAEREAIERIGASRLQTSVCEQELIAAKSDLIFLTKTMDEMREAEASRRASLEYRIGALEDDREVLRRLHADEQENLRNELTHVSMEKERILNSLKESEKKNAALVYSTSKEHASEHDSSSESELTRLRMEKAQLLTSASEEGSRTERRIREAVAAHASSHEAEVIVERELRLAAEAALVDMKINMEALKSSEGGVNLHRIPTKADTKTNSTATLEKLNNQLRKCEEEVKKLVNDNAALHIQLEKANAESKATIAELTEKCCMAHARAHKLERLGHFDADVNAEVIRLRNGLNTTSKPDSWIVVSNNPIEDDPAMKRCELSASEAYDYIQEQKAAIQEERAMYLELLGEHDDLLALLAQQDLEKASLNSALVKVAGQEAADAAITEAEENAVKQFGKYVKLT